MRTEAFREKKQNWLDEVLFFLRTRLILRNVKKNASIRNILDVGCGYDAMLLSKIIKFSPFIEKAFGIDILVSSQLKNYNINLIQSDINKRFPLEDNFFDAIFCTAVIEHVDNYELMLKEICRVLKLGGIFFLTTPVAPFAKPVLDFFSQKLKLLDANEVMDHKKYFSLKWLQEALEDAGFKEIKIKRFLFGLNMLAICRKK